MRKYKAGDIVRIIKDKEKCLDQSCCGYDKETGVCGYAGLKMIIYGEHGGNYPAKTLEGETNKVDGCYRCGGFKGEDFEESCIIKYITSEY